MAAKKVNRKVKELPNRCGAPYGWFFTFFTNHCTHWVKGTCETYSPEQARGFRRRGNNCPAFVPNNIQR